MEKKVGGSGEEKKRKKKKKGRERKCIKNIGEFPEFPSATEHNRIYV